MEKFNSFIPSKITEDYLVDLELNNPERQQERLQNIDKISNELFEEKKEDEFIEKLVDLGETMQESTYYNLHHSPENYVKIEEIKNDSSPDLFVPGILSSYLEQNGIKNIIQKNSNTNEKTSNIILQSIFNGDAFNHVIHLHLSYGEYNNHIILNDEEKQKEYILDKQKNYVRILNKNIDDIIISKPREGQLRSLVAVKNSSLKELKEFSKIIKEYEESKNTKIIDINFQCLLSFCPISQSMFDHNFDRLNDDWGRNEKRGPPGYLMDYDPPIGFKGYGLKVSKQYDNGDDTWLGYENKIGEWYIAYHGTSGHFAKSILDEGLKAGFGQAYKGDININPLSKDEFGSVMKGVYCSPKIREAVKYTKGKEVTFNNKNFIFIFMLRVNPYKIRICAKKPDYWVFKGDDLNKKTNRKHFFHPI